MSSDKNQNKKKSLFSTSFSLNFSKEREYFIENLSMLVISGMGVLAALESIRSDIRSQKMLDIIEQVQNDVEEGAPLWRSLEKTNILPGHAISLLRIGEKTGKLAENLRVIAQQEAKDKKFRSELRSAMMYPVFVFSLTIIIGVGIAWFILPRLAIVFAQLRIKLPLLTRILISVGIFLKSYGIIAVPLLFLFIFLIVYFTFFFSKTKYIGQELLFRLPGVKKLIQELELARFGYLFGSLLEAGLPINSALGSLKQSTTFVSYEKFYDFLKTSITEGNSFKKTFSNFPKSEKLIPNPIQHMIVAGEHSGKLSETLIKIGQNFEQKTEVTTKNLTVILEPFLLVVVWLGVMGVALAVIMPIYGLIGGFETAPQSTPPASAQPITTASNGNLNADENNNLNGNENLNSNQNFNSNINSNTNSNDTSILPELEIKSNDLGYVNIHTNPNWKSDIVSQVKSGEKYKYSGQESGWYQIVLEDGGSGWIQKNNITVTGNQ